MFRTQQRHALKFVCDDRQNAKAAEFFAELIWLDNKYRLKVRITSYDVGMNRRLKPSSILRIIQEAASRHLEQDGLTYEYMRSKGVVFLLVKECVKINSYPRCEDIVTAETWFHGYEGVAFVREVRFLSEAGETLIEAQTNWVTADPETHRIIRPSMFPFSMPEVSDCVANVKPRRIRIPKDAEMAGIREVRFSDIDCNSHMNNTVYADIMCDYFPGSLSERELREFQIEYSNEALLGDKITILTAASEDGYLFEGKVGDKKCFAAFAR